LEKVVIARCRADTDGGFSGVFFADLTAADLGGQCDQGREWNGPDGTVDEVLMGCVFCLRAGQAPHGRRASRRVWVRTFRHETLETRCAASGMKGRR